MLSVQMEQRTLLGKPKDKIDNNEKSGIYEISCKDCDQKLEINEARYLNSDDAFGFSESKYHRGCIQLKRRTGID
ncbi:hypothetical protein NQ318_022859 [Aromia moschata]|uniref:Uncharacterized protein n=1 Tax=Aromia moschata TaxID=1265417 RepID=A0AAV8Y3D2_9CUCU|nr:hypothetical protein NQ318_022859 [Aromia moschata]